MIHLNILLTSEKSYTDFGNTDFLPTLRNVISMWILLNIWAIFSPQGLSMDESKIEIIKNWPIP